MQTTLPIRFGAAHSAGEIGKTIPGRMLLALSASLLVAVCAHVSVPLYFTPVPVTLQTFAVLLAGMALGPAMGFSAMALYLAEGAMGMPVFSPHGPGGIAQLIGPTGGFLWSYPLAAAAAGALVRLGQRRASQFAAALLAGAAASVVIFAMGAGRLAFLLHLTPRDAWAMAIAPFLAGEVLKVSAAAGAYAGLRRRRRS